MKIAVIGTGYVGLVTGTCFAEAGNTVICVDIDAAKVQKMQTGEIPIFEPGLEELFDRNIKEKRLRLTTDLAVGLEEAEVIFLALPTPSDEDGSADLSYVMRVAEDISPLLKKYAIIVDKSTVPPGTAEKVRTLIAKSTEVEFDVVSNPEFLQEGLAVENFMNPDRVVIGTSSERAKKIMQELYEPFVSSGNPIFFMDEKSAEITKYAANAFLSTKLSFMNEIANVCERVGANVDDVRIAIGADERIGKRFLMPGPGFGGSCFPKDVLALQRTAKENGYDFKMLQALLSVNDIQKQVLFEKVNGFFHGKLKDKIIAVWGLAFKPNTDDVRETSALALIEKLLSVGAIVQANDPEAIVNMRKLFPDESNVTFFENQYEALKDADALVIVTEWAEYRAPEFQIIKNALHTPVIIDGRNVYNLEHMQKLGFHYESIGRQVIN